jgi:hypothetical protein
MAEPDRETLILNLALELRALASKASDNGNITSAIQACTRQADLLLSLVPEKPSGSNGVRVTIAGDDVNLVRDSRALLIKEFERIAERTAAGERETGHCSRCGGPINGAAAVPALTPSDQALVEGERKRPERRDPLVPGNWYATDDSQVH